MISQQRAAAGTSPAAFARRAASPDLDPIDGQARLLLDRELATSIAEADTGDTEDFAAMLAELREM